MSRIEAQNFLQAACWDDISGDRLISALRQTEPSDTALARLAQSMGYAVIARDINELKNDEELTRQPKHNRYTRLIIGGQEWHVCNLFLNDETLESEEEEEEEEDVLELPEEWNEYLLEVGEDGCLELNESITRYDLSLSQGGGCYLVFEHSSPLSSGHLISLYSDEMPDPTSGDYDAHLKVTDKGTLVVDRHILDRVGLHSGNWVSVKTSTITDFCAYIYRAFQCKAPNASIILTGPELLAKVKELGDVSKSDLARRCGYVSYRSDGSERLNLTAFYEALLDAKGVSLGRNGGGRDKRGCKLNYITTVQANGNLLIGKDYTAMLDLRPGDEFEIKLGSSQIRLVPLGDTEGKSDDDYVRLSTLLEREGDYEGAIAAITVAINLKPRMAPWYLNRAQTWMAWSRWSEAIPRWSEAIQDCTTALVDCDPLTGGPFPFRCVIYSQRAIARVGMGDWSAACADWQALLADRPGDIEALVGLTLAYGHLDQSQQAENCWQEVSARLPSRGMFVTMDWFAEQCLHPWQGPLELAMRQLFAETSRTREENMGHIPVVSTNVNYIAYDPETSELQVAFKNITCWEPEAPDDSWEECRVYRYSDVPAHIFAGLKNADSKGSYIYHNIAFMYQYERIY